MKNLRIRQERIRRDWTQEYVGQQVGITKTAVHDIEKGNRDPSYKVLCNLEKLFNLSHRQLFAVADENNPSTK